MNEDIRSVMVAIPSLNPDENLPKLVTELAQQGFTHIVVVNDGSKAECAPIFDRLRAEPACTVLEHPVNRGKGAGLKTAMEHFQAIREREGLVGIVTADADGQHLPVDIARTARCMLEKPGYLVLGTRDFNAENVPFKSRNGNKITTQVFRLLYGKTIHDFMTGLRGIPGSWMEECLKCKGDRFEYEVNMLIAAVRQRVPIEELIIETVYYDGNRATTFHPVRDSMRVYAVIFGAFLRFSCASLACVLLDQGLFALFQKVVFAALGAAAAIWAATAAARLISSFCNYTINRHAVFQSTGNGTRSLARYYILCAGQLLCSAACVAGLHTVSGWDPSILKIPVDVALFFISYRVQQRWVFA